MMSFGLTLGATHLVKSGTSPKVGHLVIPDCYYPECLNTPPASKFFVMLNRLAGRCGRETLQVPQYTRDQDRDDAC